MRLLIGIAGASARVILLILLVTAGTFVLQALLPGDPAVQMAGEFATPEQVAAIRAELGLDRPVHTRYLEWLAAAVRGDLGTSPFSGVPVTTQLADRVPVTASLIGVAAVMAAVVGIPAGLAAGWRPGSLVDRIVTGASTGLLAAPLVVVAPVAAVVVGVALGWLPATGYVPMGESPIAWLRHLLLPAGVLAASSAAELAVQSRAAASAVAQERFVEGARALGMRPAVLVLRHGLPHTLAEVVTVAGLQTGRLLGLAVVVEQVFLLPGLGSRLLAAVFENDLPFVQGTVLVTGTAVILANMAAEAAQARLDPRIRAA